MPCLSTKYVRVSAAIAAVVAMPGGAACATAAPDADVRIVLVGARWCAPCHAEVEALPALVSAAAPARITLAWLDRPPRLEPRVALTVELLAPAAARDLAERFLPEGRGIPFAVALDAAGRACAVHRGPLTTADAAALRARCAAGARAG